MDRARHKYSYRDNLDQEDKHSIFFPTIVDTSTESLGIFGISIEAKKLVRGLRGWVQGKECKMEVT